MFHFYKIMRSSSQLLGQLMRIVYSSQMMILLCDWFVRLGFGFLLACGSEDESDRLRWSKRKEKRNLAT